MSVGVAGAGGIQRAGNEIHGGASKHSTHPQANIAGLPSASGTSQMETQVQQ